MASSTGDSEGWSTKARRSSAEDPAASKNPKNLEQTGPLFDPLEGTFAAPAVPTDRPAPVPERTPPRGRPAPKPPEPFDHQEPFAPEQEETIYAPPRRRVPPPGRRTRRVRQVRRVKRTLRHIDPLTVFKVSIMYGGVFLLLWLLLVAVLYWIVQGAGVFETLDEARDLLKVEGSWTPSLSLVEKWAFFIGLAMAIVMALFNTFLAIIYNIVADTIGGLDMTFVERD